MKTRFLKISFPLLILIFVQCTKRNIHEEIGYIVYDQPLIFTFLPVYKMDLQTSISSFQTSNLKNGINFSSKSLFFGSIDSLVDTFYIQNHYNYEADYLYLKILPVKLSYKYLSEKEKYYDQTLTTSHYKIRGLDIIYKSRNSPVEITKVTPLMVKNRNIKSNFYHISDTSHFKDAPD
ncbi:MAG: hypothetical protein AB9842_06155 [Bacteroidales bacterium]